MDGAGAIMLRDLDRRMRAARRRPADEQWHGKSFALHLLGHVHHLIERWRDQAAQPDHVCFAFPRRFQNFRGRNHHPEIDDLVVITLQHHAHDIFADVVDVAFHGRHDDARLRFRVRAFLRLHERQQICDRFLHHPRAFHHLRQKHFSGAEQIADHAHPSHERSFDHFEWPREFLPRLFRVGLYEIDNAFHQCVRETVLDRRMPPRLFFNRRFLRAFDVLSEFDQPLRRVVAPVEEDVFDARFQFRLDFFINGELAGVDDRHVEPGLDGVK